MCRDAGVLQDEEEQEEATGSLLGGADQSSSPEEEDGEENSCPPLLAVPPVSQRLQSTLQCIDLSVQQVDPLVQSKDQNPESYWRY